MSSRGRGIPAPWGRSSAAVSTVVTDHGAWAARPHMDDTFRRQWAIQLARERAEQARIPTSSFEDEVAEAVERPARALEVAGAADPLAAGARRRGRGRELRPRRHPPRLLALDDQPSDRTTRGRDRRLARREGQRLPVGHGDPCRPGRRRARAGRAPPARERRESSWASWHAGSWAANARPGALGTRSLPRAQPRADPRFAGPAEAGHRSSTVPRPDRGSPKRRSCRPFLGTASPLV